MPRRLQRAFLIAALWLMAVPAAASALATPRASGTGGVWTGVSGALAQRRGGAALETRPGRYRAFALDRATLSARLRGSPPENTRAARGALPQISIPAPDGTLERFRFVESPVMAPALARKVPGVRTYAGSGVDDPTATVRFDLTPLGFHASVRGADGAWYVDPAYHGDQGRYVTYYGRDLGDVHGPLAEREPPIPASGSTPMGNQRAPSTPGSLVIQRTYRLALVSDPSYAGYFGSAMVDAAKAILINRVDQVYNDDLAVKLELVAHNDLLNLDTPTKFTGRAGPCAPASCYPPGFVDCGDVVDSNQAVVDRVIGTAEYDIGHIALGLDGGGIAGLGVVGRPGQKAKGCTGIPVPRGDAYAIDYVAHEMGHQFSGNHTFNGTQSNCAGDNRNDPTAVEPGSGSSIMAYAGICDTDNLQRHSDPYFSQRSIQEIQAYVTSSISGATNQGAPATTANRSPVVTPPAARSIPALTPFTLTGSATDPDGDPLIFMWEQNDPGTGTGLVDNRKPNGALFRQFSFLAIEGDPFSSPALGENTATAADLARTFPDLAQVAAGNTNAATGSCPPASSPPTPTQIDCFSEFLPADARTMNFRLTARDRVLAGGGVSHGDVAISVSGTVPFRVTSQTTPTDANFSTPVPVRWTAGTDAAPFDVADVKISYSTDSGLTFPTVLAASTPNDGGEDLLVPPVDTTQGRFKVEASDNYFFDISHADLTAGAGVTPSPTTTPTATSTSTATATATATGAPTPYALPGALRPSLARTARRLTISNRGRVTIKLSCQPVDRSASVPATCSGRVRLTARFKHADKRKPRTIASKAFSIAATTTRSVKVKLSTRARRSLRRRSLKVMVRAAVANPNGSRSTSRRVTLKKRKT